MKGGARQGAGRPKGSGNKLNILDFLEDGDAQKVVDTAKELALTKKDPRAVNFLIEQIFGKAKQSIEMGGELDTKAELTDEQFERIIRLHRTNGTSCGESS